jgi:hypothetical protein
MPDAAGFALVLEFDLPRTGGRRPDLIVLENGNILVVEFKNRVVAELSDLDQVLDYIRNLELYHAASRTRCLIPILVPIGMTEPGRQERGVHIVAPAGLGKLIRHLARGAPGRRVDGAPWINSPYEPLPALVEAARLIFERKPLPRIRQAESANIPQTVDRISSAIRNQVARRGRTLVLLTGVPGSGKTLVGLKLVHSRELGVPTVFLSGNGPLVQVLRYVLDNDVFVQDVHAFMRDHHIRPGVPPRERIVIFDEAQRAWDRDQVLYHHEGRLTSSEPELLVRIGERCPEGFALVALIGEGQQIHIGEESGIEQWADALGSDGGWEVIGPQHLAAPFVARGTRFEVDPLLNLTTGLRSHRATDVSLWAGLVLDGRLEDAGRVATSLAGSGFAIYASRHLDTLKKYICDRYAGDSTRRFGLLTSSKFRKISELGVEVASHRFWYYGRWFEEPASDPKSCCRLDLAITEFGCQGLELDLPLICWGPDLTWDGGKWHPRVRRSPRVRDARKLRLNAYRVLLTRGRDGVVIWVPPEPTEIMDPTFEALRRAGAQPL